MIKQSWQPENGLLLKELRQSANVEIFSLAKIYCISSSQITQLEDGGDRGFYSSNIKFSVGKKLLLHFGCHIKIIPITLCATPLPIIQESVIFNIHSFRKLKNICFFRLLRIKGENNDLFNYRYLMAKLVSGCALCCSLIRSSKYFSKANSISQGPPHDHT
jgi:hypothetical protein